MEFQNVSRRSSILLGERRTTVFQRLVAKGIDALVVAAIFFLGKAVWVPLGMVAAASFCAMQDALGVGQSVGKRIMGLRVIDDASGIGCTFQDSFLRNLPMTLIVICAPIPVFWAISLFVNVPILCLEIYLLSTVDSGVRLGDIMGNTLVDEYVEHEITAIS